MSASTKAPCMRERHHWLTGSATLIEIGIARCPPWRSSPKRMPFWLGAMGLGPGGTGVVRGRLSHLTFRATMPRLQGRGGMCAL